MKTQQASKYLLVSN